MKKRLAGTAGVVVTLFTINFMLGSPGFADSGTLDSLVKLNPGITAEQLLLDAEVLAKKYNTTPEAILSQQLAKAQESVAAAAEAGMMQPNGSGGGTIKLGPGDNKGDIFISPASTLYVEHGHTGVYVSSGVIVEAPGFGQDSHYAYAASLDVGVGTVKQHVVTTQTKRNSAADYAYYHMRGKPYNLNFNDNKYVPADSYNCSQLVWGAYKHKTGIDLDSNGGSGVFPYDIKNSNKTVTYQTL